MLDLPIPDNSSIIIFSATNAPEGVEGGRVRQNITFSAQTPLTISGGIVNDFCRIEPSGNTFTAVARTREAAGNAIFTVTVRTAGDSQKGLEPAEEKFTFRVLVLGTDLPHLTQNFFEFRVGETVSTSLPVWFAAQQAHLNIAKSYTPITSQTCGREGSETDEHGIVHRTWEGEPSGIAIAPVLDSENEVRGATLTGIASRPGIYYYKFEISSFDRYGGPYAFPGATGYAMLIINIYDDRETPMIKVPYAYTSNPDYLRVIDHGLGDAYVVARLEGEFTRSGEVWIRTVRETINQQVSDVWEYRIEHDVEQNIWTLSGRNYLSDESIPEYSPLATASERFGEIPPNTGWTGGVLCAGDGAQFVAESGFFDFKGERELPIESEDADPFRGPVYEQQPVISEQYAGWTNPPRLQHHTGLYLAPAPDEKWYITAEPLDFGGNPVEPRTIEAAVVPYMPPTFEATGKTPYRDVALCGADRIPINAHLAGPLTLRSWLHPAAVQPHYTFLRQAVPPNNADISYSVPFSYEKKVSEKMTHYHKSVERNCYRGDWSIRGGDDNWSEKKERRETLYRFSGTLPADAWTRSEPNLLSGLIGSITGVAAAPEYKYENESVHHWGWIRYPIEGSPYGGNYKNDRSLKHRVVDPGTQHGIVHAVFGSGRDSGDNTVCGYTAAAVEAGAANLTYIELESGCSYDMYWDEDGEVIRNDDKWENQEVDTGSIGFNIGMVSPAVAHSALGVPEIGGYTVEIVNASTGTHWDSAVQGYNKEGVTIDRTIIISTDPYETKREITGKHITFTATHEHTCYSGNVPPGLVDRGKTCIRKTTEETGKETLVEEEWINDPRGEYFKTIQHTYGQPIEDFYVGTEAPSLQAITEARQTSMDEHWEITTMRIG